MALVEIYYAAGRFADSWREVQSARAAGAAVAPALVSLLIGRVPTAQR